MRIRSVSLLAATALLIAGTTVNHAQDWGGKAPEPRTGRLMPAQSEELKIDLEGNHGELKLTSLLAPGTEVSQGDIVAAFEAPELAEKTAEAETALALAEQAAAMASEGLAAHEASSDLSLRRATENLARAEEALKHFLETGKARRIRSSELGLESYQHSIQDQEEELAQLEKLYQGNNLAKESQDIVLNRSKRRLKTTKERFKFQQADHQRTLNVEIPRHEWDLERNVESAKLQLASAQSESLNGLTGLRIKDTRAQEAVKSASEQVQKLKDNAAKLELKAPFAGVVLAGALNNNDGLASDVEVGDEVRNGQILATVITTKTLQLTVSIEMTSRAAYQPGTKVAVSQSDLGVSTSGTVKSIGFMVDKHGFVSTLIEVDNSEGKLLPGAQVSISLQE